MNKINIVFKDKRKYCLFLFLGMMMLSFVTINDTSAANYTLTLTSSGSQNINVTADTNTAISADNINVATTCRYGYNFTINTSVNNNNLYLNGNSANNQSDTYFTPSNGTASLKNNPNSWGYYYSSTNPTIAPTADDIFYPVPTLANPATVKTPLSTPASSDINDSFNIYYGVSSSSSMTVGNYKMIPDTNNSNNDGTIVYTATIADACISYTVHFNPTSYFNGVQITGAGTMGDQTIYEGMSTPLANVTFSNPTTINNVNYYFLGWNTAQDGSGTSYINTEDVLDLTSAGNNITLYAMWTDCPNGNICYDSNEATGPIVDGNIAKNANQSISNTATEVMLRVPNYYRTNYGFLGWSKEKLNPDDNNFATKFKNATATNKVYGPNETLAITTGQYSTGGLRLYAVWLPKSTTYTMQTFGETQCANNLTKITYSTDNTSNSGVLFTTENETSITLDSLIALQDARDTNVYTVARLTDGNCWMLENLRLENTNSDNSTGNLAQGYHTDSTYGNFIGLAEPETNFTYTSPAIANSLYSQDGSTIINIGDTNSPASRIPRYNNYNTQSAVASSTGGVNTYGYGNYYTWSAAMANTTSYDSATSTDSGGKTSDEVNTSICPKGWRLPYGMDTGYGTTSKGFSYLSVSMGGLNTIMRTYDNPSGKTMGNRLRQFPNNYVYSGYFLSQSVNNRVSYAKYWSSTSKTIDSAYILYFIENTINPGSHFDSKDNGLAVRCVAGN